MMCNVIISRNCMKQIAVSMDFASSTINWLDKSIQFHPRNFFQNKDLVWKIITNEPCTVDALIATSKSAVHVDSETKHKDTDLSDLINQQKHLSAIEKSQLLDVLPPHKASFSGLDDRQLGVFPDEECHLHPKPNSKPFHLKQPHAFHRSFWKSRADSMAPLTALQSTPKGIKLKKTPELLKCFNDIKKMIAQEVLLVCPNPNRPCHLHSDASDTQLSHKMRKQLVSAPRS